MSTELNKYNYLFINTVTHGKYFAVKSKVLSLLHHKSHSLTLTTRPLPSTQSQEKHI